MVPSLAATRLIFSSLKATLKGRVEQLEGLVGGSIVFLKLLAMPPIYHLNSV